MKNAKEYLKTYVDAGTAALVSPNGTARLISGCSTLQRAHAADVTTDQMKAIFPDLKRFSRQKIEGFMEISAGLISGEIQIPSTLFNDIDLPKGQQP